MSRQQVSYRTRSIMVRCGRESILLRCPNVFGENGRLEKSSFAGWYGSKDDPRSTSFKTQLQAFANDLVCAALTVTKHAKGGRAF